MNTKIIFIVVSLWILNSCYNYERLQKNIVIKQVPCNESILLLRDTIKNEIYQMITHYEFDIYKTCLWKISLESYGGYYGYDGYAESDAKVIFVKQHHQIIPFDENKEISELEYNKSKKFIIQAYNLINYKAYQISYEPKPFSYTEQKQFLKPYLDSMNKLHLDTLRIGSIAEVQRTNPKFFDYFIPNIDSLFLNFNYRNKWTIRKFVPIEIK